MCPPFFSSFIFLYLYERKTKADKPTLYFSKENAKNTEQIKGVLRDIELKLIAES